MIRRRDMPVLLTPLLAGCKPAAGSPVRITVPTGLVEAFLAPLALSLGHFREEGVGATIEELAGARNVESLLAGSSDFAYTSYSEILTLAGEARRLRSVFAGNETLSSVLAVNRKKAHEIRRVEDLRGAIVGVSGPGSAQHQFLLVLLSRHGLSSTDVRILAHGTGPSAIASIEHGRVDAGMINGSAFNVLKRRAPGVRVLIDPRTREVTAEVTGAERWVNFCLFSRVKWLRDNQDTARKTVRAMLRTLRWSHAHPAERIREQLPSSFRADDLETDLETLRILLQGVSADGRMPPTVPAGVLHYVAETNEKVRNAKIDLAATYTNQFVDEAMQ